MQITTSQRDNGHSVSHSYLHYRQGSQQPVLTLEFSNAKQTLLVLTHFIPFPPNYYLCPAQIIPPLGHRSTWVTDSIRHFCCDLMLRLAP